MTDILDEVLKDQSDEKKLRFFRKLLPIVIFLTVVVVIGMLTSNWWIQRKLDLNKEIGDILIESLNNEDIDKNLSFKLVENIVKNNQNKISELAALEKVVIKIKQNDQQLARDILDKIIHNKDYHDLTTSYAKLIWLGLIIEENNLKDQDKSNIQDYLSYFSDEKRPFFGSASLIKSLWYIKLNQVELARQTLSMIINKTNIPYVIKEQAKALMSSIESKAV